jgi:iron complex outermembrane receptor protein
MSKLKTIAFFTVIAAAMAAGPVHAQLEEITVTAQKRVESAQDVPLAVSTVGEELLADVKVTTITEILPYVPGLTGHTAGGTDPVFAIRGISSNAFGNGSEPSIGVFLDEAYVGRNVLASSAFFDLARVEVLKGPQGTLFGRNAASGAINAITVKPELEENTLHVGLGAGNYDQVRANVEGNVALGESAAARVSFMHDSHDGIQTNLFDGSKVNDKDMSAVRLSLLVQPTDRFEVIFRAQFSEYEGLGYTGPVGALEGTGDYPDAFNANIGGGRNDIDTRVGNNERVDTAGANLRLNLDLTDSLSLTSITDYREWEMDFGQDVDGSGLFYVNYYQDAQDADTFSQEFRLNGSSDRIDWFIGASYFEESVGGPQQLDADLCTLGDVGFLFPGDIGPSDDIDGDGFVSCQDIIDYTGGDGTELIIISDQLIDRGEYEALAIYGDMTYQVTDVLSLTAGLRYTRDDKDFRSFGNAGLGVLGSDTAGQWVSGSNSWSDTSPRFAINYDVNDDVMIYASYAEGYKAGGFNTAVNVLADPFEIRSFDPEENTTYELGVKSELASGSLRLNAAFYYMDYRDLQVETLDGALPFVSNVSDAEVTGAEVEAVWATPVDGLVLTGNFAVMSHEYIDGFVNGEDVSGRELNAAPERTASLLASYTTDVGAGRLDLFGAVNYQSKMHFDISNADFLAQEAYTLVNARIRYTGASEKWDVGIVGENLTDEDFSVRRQDPLGFGAQVIRGNPRFARFEANFYF